MKSIDLRTAVLLDEAVELMFGVYVLRGRCSDAAKLLTTRGKALHPAMEDCAKLDDALARNYRVLQQTVRAIQRSRARRRSSVG